jgi:Carboxypeptidase regulatory-like domain
MVRKGLALGLITGLALLVFCRAAWPQAVNSAVEGLVTDPTNSPVPAAQVTLTDLGTGVVKTTVTNQVGLYVFPAVPVGSYSLKVSKEGFKTFNVAGFDVTVAARVTENAVLALGSVTQSVTVEGHPPLLEPSSNELGTLITPMSVEQLPLNGRNFLQLGLLAGAATDSGTNVSDFVSVQGGHPGLSIVIAGTEQDLSMYLIDGMQTTASRLGNLQLNVSVAAIDQFKVRQGFFLPGLGPDPGIVNVITKSGSNTIHGEAFEFLRNNALDARNFFDTAALPPFRRNQFGFAVGGPVKKDKTFFFGHYEGLRQVLTNQGRAFTPTSAMFNGDFSALLPSVVIYDPATFDPATGKRQPFPGNIIPAGRINSVAKNLLPFYTPGASYAERPFNLFGSVPTSYNSDEYGVRIDQNFGPQDTLFGEFMYENSPVVNGSLFPLAGSTFPLKSTLAALHWTHVLNPRLVNEFRIGWTGGSIFVTGQQESNIANQVGIPGTADSSGIPAIVLSSFNTFGTGRGQLGDIDNVYQLHDDVSYLRGDHQIRFGMDIRYTRSIQQSANADARGTINFTNRYTAQLTQNAQGKLVPIASTGNAFADFLLGMPIAGRVISMPRMHYRWTQAEPYITDSWKIRRGLTLNAGFSWFLATPPDPVGSDKNLIHTFDFQTGQVLFSALGQANPEIYPMPKHDFTPRLGLAWEPGFAKNTVVRAGWGMYYASQRILDQQNAVISPGVSIVTSFTNGTFDPLPQYTLGTNVFPSVFLGPITPQFANTLSGTMQGVDAHNRDPYVEQWNLAIDHTFGTQDLLEVAYLGNEGHHLNNRFTVDGCTVPNSLQCDPNAITWPQYQSFLFSANEGDSSYEALVAKFQHHFSHGVSFLTNYTWGKALARSMESGATATVSQMYNCRKCDKGLAGFNQAQRLVMSGIWNLPFGHGKRYLGSVGPLADRLVGGWDVNVITTFAGGNPFEVNAPNNTSETFSDLRANRLCNGRASLSNQNLRTNGGMFLDTSCFVAPAAGYFGTSGFDILSGPGINNWDIGLEKNTTIHEDVRLQFRTEFFNAFNHAQFNNPNSNVANLNFGRVLSARTAREIQFALKLLW